ncbi:MAG: tRNA threonylcarbamoyladenosine dehydratase [Bacteroidales bacterium]|nr:tRNA threonylcarbamoyladenosine dehydratase [Bacteroidales bacterium]
MTFHPKPWQERSRMLVGDDMLGKFADSTVAVIGVGGVGGYAAEMIVRAGIGHLIILDSDDVAESNKNRQLLALDSTIGRPKCEVLSERLKDINPELDLTVIQDYFEPEKADELLGGRKIDFLVDAIDTLSPKLALIKYCMDNGIPLVSSMGAGAKFDATKVRLADVSKSYNCPLAYIVRKRLRHMGISKGFKVVFSEELPDRDSIVPCQDRNKKSQVGTISYIPAVFGCVCAQAAIRHIMESER